MSRNIRVAERIKIIAIFFGFCFNITSKGKSNFLLSGSTREWESAGEWDHTLISDYIIDNKGQFCTLSVMTRQRHIEFEGGLLSRLITRK